MDAQAAANVLIEEANAAKAAGDLDGAISLYRAGIDRFPAYASYNLVVGDMLYHDGRLTEAIEAYQATVDAVPEHVQAWERLAECLSRVGRRDDADCAYRRLQELQAELVPGDANELIEAYRSTDDINERAALVCDLSYSLDEQVPQILHEFLSEVAHDRRNGRHGSGNTFWCGVANTLVRFGIADFVHWYTDGPGPNHEWITDDVDTYLRENRYPPPIEKHQPIYSNPPPQRR